MRIFTSSFVSLIAIFGAVACGGAQPPAEPAPQPPASAPVAVPPEEPKTEPAKPEEGKPEEAKPEAKPAWKDMSKEQRVELMKTEVMPKMGALFKEFDAKEFAEFSCKTCHGAGAKEGKFAMPNAKLPVLDPKNDFAKHKKDAKMLEFMAQKVVPEMIAILGATPFDPAAKTGFGCGGCHTMK